MPGWLLPVIIGLATVLAAPFITHMLQQRRERKREAHEARAAWVARQRGLCASLLGVAITSKSMLFTMRSLHDDRPSRLTAKKTLEVTLQQMPSFAETVRNVRQELDLEPNAQLQGAIERWGDAGIAYQQALTRPMTSWWPLGPYLGRTPQDEVNRLAEDFDARTHELQAAARAYMASLEPPVKAKPSLLPTSLLQLVHKIRTLAGRQKGRVPAY